MRVSSFPPTHPTIPPFSPANAASSAHPVHHAVPSSTAFIPLSAQAFSQAHTRHVPVFLLLGEISHAFSDPSVSAHLNERTIPVHLPVGVRPDIELLCQRAGALFSDEGALPLCALLLDNGHPFLAAPLPPGGYPLDPARLYVWLSQADRRFMQNPPGIVRQASQVIRSFQPPALAKPYTPQDAAHDLLRSATAIEDKLNGGFGKIKSPLPCILRFLQRTAIRNAGQAHAALNRALDAMLTSALYDPIDGLFFHTTLTETWQVFVPEKPLAVNAMLALILLGCGRRSEAMRILDAIISAFSLDSGALAASLSAQKSSFSFTPEQICAALGHEDGLQACRLLGLLHRHAREEPCVSPSRFSPVADSRAQKNADDNRAALYPTLSSSLTPEDNAFLRRIVPVLLRVRSARAQLKPSDPLLCEHMAFTAAILAKCGKRLGEIRYTQAAQRVVSFIARQPSASGAFCALPASALPVQPLYAQATCGAGAALALAMLTLGSGDGMAEYAESGLQLLSGVLHAFVQQDGLVMHTPRDPAAFFPRVPAVYDTELPSPAALLVHCLRIGNTLCPQAHYDEAIQCIWEAAAPAAHHQPLACAALIDAVNAQ